MLAGRKSSAALAAIGVVPWTARASTWTVTSIGRGIVDVLGYPRAAWHRRGFWLDCVHPQDRDTLLAYLEESVAGSANLRPFSEYRATDADGDWHWLRTTVEPPRPRARVATGLHLDVTPAHTAHDLAGDPSADPTLRDLWESLPSSAAMIDREGTIVRFNHVWALFSHRYGGPSDAFLGSNYLDSARAAAMRGDDIAEKAARGIESVLKGASRVFKLDYPCWRPGVDQPTWYRMKVYPRSIRNGGAIILHEDITDNVQAESQAHADRSELTRRLRRAELNEMASLLTHELTQPLSVIMSSASTARQILRDRPHSDMLTAILGDMLQAVGRAGQVVHQTRAMVSREQSRLEWFEVSALLDDVIRLLARDVAVRQVSLSLDVKTSQGITGDRAQMQEAMLNLVLNAIEAVAGQPRDRRKVRVSAHDTGDNDVAICVSDTGAGISPLVRSRLFEPFVTSKPEGVGLGLSMIRTVVRAHGGEIVVENSTESGAAFRVVIPATYPETIEWPDLRKARKHLGGLRSSMTT
jgi:signal transduction histidine kinase